MWTVKDVKRDLPAVTVILRDGTLVVAQVAGQKKKHPVLWLYLHETEVTATATWDTIVYCLNHDTPIIL